MYTSPAVAQIIPTVQCEISIGEPNILVRLNGCNLHCPWCDSKYTWKKNTHITDEDINQVIELQKKYPNVIRLMITGGEPLLYADDPNFYQLINLEMFQSVQIETNGTLLQRFQFDEIYNKVVTFNISPKVEAACYKDDFNIDHLIKSVRPRGSIHQFFYNYKFVYTIHQHDNILQFIKKLKEITQDEVKNHQIYIMAKTPRIGEPNITYDDIAGEIRQREFAILRLCLKHGFHFTPRYHLNLFNFDIKEMAE